MKRINAFGAFLIALWLIYQLLRFALNIIVTNYLSDQEMEYLRAALAINTVASHLIHIGIFVWLFVKAKTDRNPPLVWAALGLFFGATGVALYFAKQIHNKVSSLELSRMRDD